MAAPKLTALWPRALAIAAAALLVAAVPLLSDDRYLVKVLTYVGVNVVIVTGLALLFGYAGQVSLGHAAFFGIGAYASAFVTAKLGWPWLAGVATAIAVAAAGGALLAVPSLRLRGHYLAMATLAFGEIASVAFVEAAPVTGGVNGFGGIPVPSVGPLRLDDPQELYWLVWGVAVATMLLARNITVSRPGLALRALHGTELGAQAVGVDVVRLKVLAFTVSAGLAGLAGSLYAHSTGFISPPSFGLHASVGLLAMVVVGGTRSLLGPALAATVLTLLPYASAVAPGLPEGVLKVLEDWQADIYGLAIILVMLFAPSGVAGAVRALKRRRSAPAGSVEAGEREAA